MRPPGVDRGTAAPSSPAAAGADTSVPDATVPAGADSGGLAGRSVVVLGGSGFIGGRICDAFSTAGARVLSVSRRAEVSELGGARDRVALDLAQAGPAEIAQLLAGVRADVLVNAAGMVWQASEETMLDLNGHLVGRIVEALGRLSRRPRLLQLGSAYEYGPVAAGSSVDEEHPPAPDSAYGRSKLIGAQAVLGAADADGIDGAVLRLAVVSGPGAPRTSLLGVVAAHLAALGRGTGPESELRLAPLRAHRDFVDVRDVADAVLIAAQLPAGDISGQVVNVGSGEAVPVRWVVDRMIALSGYPVEVRSGVSDLGGSVRSAAEWLQLDISRARRLLGWKPRRSLDESLVDLLAAA